MRMNIGSYIFPDRSIIMGILNVTPDSFVDGGKYCDVDTALFRAEQMVTEGADIIDIGAESSRPGAMPVSVDEEIFRLLPIVEKIREEIDVPISIDTYKPQVARECLLRGATLINDISGLRDEQMIEVIASFHAAVVIMHMQGEPRTMQAQPTYTDVVQDVFDYLQEKVLVASRAGIRDIFVDPGIGFGKTLEHNLQLLAHIETFCALGHPVLLGVSRKSFLGVLAGGLAVEDRLEGTLAAQAIALYKGVSIIRVHDVLAAKRMACVVDSMSRGIHSL